MKALFSFLACFLCLSAMAQQADRLTSGPWQGRLHRKDGVDIVFNFEVKDSAGKKVIYIINGGEHLLVDQVEVNGDSVNFKMPFFDSEFRTRFDGPRVLQGYWIRHLGGAVGLPFAFTAIQGVTERFPVTGPTKRKIGGRWATYFITPKDTAFAVGEFTQTGSKVTGTFLTPTGDYRFLEGSISGDTLSLSTFDGSHAYVFQAQIDGDKTLSDGMFYGGFSNTEKWYANKDKKAALPAETALAGMRPGQKKLNFAYNDLNGHKVSINDPAYKGKVVIVTLLGSWCPNCMDENAYLGKWYKENKTRGIEIIGLAYERTTDSTKSKESLQPFIKRFGITYPILLTGVTSGDPAKGSRTLPQLTDIKGFPTTIFIGKDGNVKEVHTGFSGPGTGEHYETFKKEFNQLVDNLLKQELTPAKPAIAK